MISTISRHCASVSVSGGARRTTTSCVGLVIMPARGRRRSQRVHVQPSSQQRRTVVRQAQAELPGVQAAGLRVDDHGVEEARAAHRADAAVRLCGERAQLRAHQLAHARRVLRQLLLHDDAQRLGADGARQRVAAPRAAVLARPDGEHHGVVRQHRGDGVQPAAQRLAQAHDVGAHARRVAAQQRAGAAQARLHLVSHHQHVVLLAQRRRGGQVARRGQDDARLALDGLHLRPEAAAQRASARTRACMRRAATRHEARHVRVLQRALQRRQVVVRHDLEAWAAWTRGMSRRSLGMQCARHTQRRQHAPGTKGPKRS